MAVPSFLNWSYVYSSGLGIDDVQDIMDDFATQAASVSWTNPSAGLYQSPADSGGRWMDILLTRTSATILEFRVRDHSGSTVGTRRLQISASAPTTNYNIFIGQCHAVITAHVPNQAAREYLMAFIPDPDPEAASGCTTTYVVMKGYRNTSTATVAQSVYDQWGAIDNGSAAYATRAQVWYNGASQVAWTTLNRGALIALPMGMNINVSGTFRYLGRVPMCLLVSDSVVAIDAELQIPISSTTIGTFKVIGVDSAANYDHYMAMRK